MAAASDDIKSWLLDKYAKYIDRECKSATVNNPKGSSGVKSNGEWKQITSLDGDGSLQITLIEGKHFMLSSGSQINESFALINTEQWLKAYCKGDSVLFVAKTNNGSRRFRVKFANTGIKTGVDNCKDFVRVASPIMPIKMIQFQDNTEASQSQFVEDSQIISTPQSETLQSVQDMSLEEDNHLPKQGSSLPEIARQIVSNNEATGSTTTTTTNLPTSDLSVLVRLCLTDPGFPDFVDKVEKELKLLTAQK
ncbi:meiotic recombination protein REC114-like [Dendronephthya gigantea]|uniref:meiotic recombination protein REC114-like n=1 Tax=Dendronephthya gigantea TaxID=151771 RepID=UPI00106B301D|nr:meiotic recombination protein REC114-like [Dendronephthya gigantea]